MNCKTCNKLSCLDCVGELEKQLAQANAEKGTLIDAVLKNSNAIVNTPPMPESIIIKYLQQIISELKASDLSKEQTLAEYYSRAKEGERIVWKLETENAALLKELAQYKKALELACDDDNICPNLRDCPLRDCPKKYNRKVCQTCNVKYYFQQAESALKAGGK
jgi:hypothetical protein